MVHLQYEAADLQDFLRARVLRDPRLDGLAMTLTGALDAQRVVVDAPALSALLVDVILWLSGRVENTALELSIVALMESRDHVLYEINFGGDHDVDIDDIPADLRERVRALDGGFENDGKLALAIPFRPVIEIAQLFDVKVRDGIVELLGDETYRDSLKELIVSIDQLGEKMGDPPDIVITLVHNSSGLAAMLGVIGINKKFIDIEEKGKTGQLEHMQQELVAFFAIWPNVKALVMSGADA